MLCDCVSTGWTNGLTNWLTDSAYFIYIEANASQSHNSRKDVSTGLSMMLDVIDMYKSDIASKHPRHAIPTDDVSEPSGIAYSNTGRRLQAENSPVSNLSRVGAMAILGVSKPTHSVTRNVPGPAKDRGFDLHSFTVQPLAEELSSVSRVSSMLMCQWI